MTTIMDFCINVRNFFDHRGGGGYELFFHIGVFGGGGGVGRVF